MKDFKVEIILRDTETGDIITQSDIGYFKAIHANRVNKLKATDVFNDMVDALVKVAYQKMEQEKGNG